MPKGKKKPQRFYGGRYGEGQDSHHIPPEYWLSGKNYGTVPKRHGAAKRRRANVNARVRNALERLERCAIERIEHRSEAAEARKNTRAGRNLAAVAKWASYNRGNAEKMSDYIAAGWELARDKGYVKGSNQNIAFDKKNNDLQVSVRR